MRFPFRSVPAALLVCLVAAGPAVAQIGDPPLDPASLPAQRPRVSDIVERTEVRVLLVDVFVADKKGNPITDLTQDDFRLYLDGDEVVIDSFELRQVPFERPLADPPDPRAVPGAVRAVVSRQKIVMLFDAWNSTPAGQQRVREQALAFLNEHGLPAAEVMVLSLGDRLRVMQEFTTDPKVLAEALRRVEDDQASLDIYSSQMDERLAQMTLQGGGSDDTRGDCHAIWNTAKAYAAEARRRARRTIEVLQGLIFALGGLDGRKSILYFSAGLALTPGGAYINEAMLSCPSSSSAARAGEVEMVTDYGELYAEANAANVTFHTVDTRLGDDGGARSFLSSLAFQTGGLRGPAVRFPLDNLVAISRQMASYYTLGTTLEAVPADGLSHNIRVEIDRPGLEIRHRRKFTDLGWREKEERSVLGAMTIPELVNDLPIEARILPFRADRNQFDLYFEIGMPMREMFWMPFQIEEIGELEFTGVLMKSSGKIIHQFRDTMELARAGDPGRGGRGVFYRGHTMIGPGSYQLVAVVHDLGIGRVGATRIRFEIPKPRSNDFSLGGVALARVSRGDMVVGAYSPFQKKKKKLPRRFRRENFVPVDQNGVSRSDVLLTYLQIYDPRRRKIESPPPLIVSISFLQNGVVHATHKPIRISEEEGEAGERSIPFAMLTPLKRFPPGDYDLRIRVEEQGTNRSLFREVPLRIVAAESKAAPAGAGGAPPP